MEDFSRSSRVSLGRMPVTSLSDSRPSTGQRLSLKYDDDDIGEEDFLSLKALLSNPGSREGEELADAYSKFASARSAYHRSSSTSNGPDGRRLSPPESLKSDLDSARTAVEEVLWPIVRDYIQVGLDSPRTLMAAARIIEELEELERNSVADEGDNENRPLVFLDKFQKQLALGANDRFRDMLERMVWGSSIEDVLKEGTAIASDLLDVSERVGPCFPASYHVEPFLRQVYVTNFAEAGTRLSTRIMRDKDRDSAKVVKEISDVMAWATLLKQKMLSFGVDKALAEVQEEGGSLDPLVDEFVERMSRFVGPALERIMNLELGKGVDGDGKLPLRTDLPPEIFRWLHAQADQAKACSNSLLLSRVAAGTCDELLIFQEKYLANLKKQYVEGSLQYIDLMASINDCMTLAELSDDLGKQILQVLDEDRRSIVNFEAVVEAFQQASKQAANLYVRRLFAERQMFAKQRVVNVDLMLAMEELFNEWQEELRRDEKGTAFDAKRTTIEAALEVMIVACVEEFICFREKFTPATLASMEEERRAIEGLFGEHIGEEVLEDRIRILCDLWGLAAADDAEMYGLCYAGLLASSWPECPPSVALKLLSCHSDFSRSELKSITEQCNAAWDDHVSSVPEASRRNPPFLTLGEGIYPYAVEEPTASISNSINDVLEKVGLSGIDLGF